MLLLLLKTWVVGKIHRDL